jgi:hypothetical protein
MVELAKVPENRLRIRVPASVVVTLLGAALTVWLAPAFTRQWGDRQAARDLKVGLAEDGVLSAFKAVQQGAGLAEGHGAYRVISRQWEAAVVKTDLRSKAYLGSIVAEWQELDQAVQYFLIVSQEVADVRARATEKPVGQRFQFRFKDISSWLNLAWPWPTSEDEEGAATPEDAEGFPTREEVDAVALMLANDDASTRVDGMKLVKTWMLARIETAADKLLSAHVSGFSTTRGDLLHDLF